MADLAIAIRELSSTWSSMSVEGEIDLATAPQLADALDGVRSSGNGNLVVDLNQTQFMDSTGLKTLVMAQRQFADDGRELVLAVKGGPISRLIDLSGVDSSIRVMATPEDVLGAE